MSVQWNTVDDGPMIPEDAELPQEYRDSLNDNLAAKSVAENLPEDVDRFVAETRQALNSLNGKLKLLKTEKGKRGNVHPYRITIHQRNGGQEVFIARTDEARPGGSTLDLADIGFGG